jgi:hypothetical protein
MAMLFWPPEYIKAMRSPWSSRASPPTSHAPPKANERNRRTAQTSTAQSAGPTSVHSPSRTAPEKAT